MKEYKVFSETMVAETERASSEEFLDKIHQLEDLIKSGFGRMHSCYLWASTKMPIELDEGALQILIGYYKNKILGMS